MTDKNDRAGLSRRQLLMLAPAAAGAQAALAAPALAEEAYDDLPDDPHEVRFRETEHVRTYYRLARS